MSPSCTLLSPARPSELLSYVLDHHVHPTTLIICSPRSDFLSFFTEEFGCHCVASNSGLDEGEGEPPAEEEQEQAKSGDRIRRRLLSSPLYQVAVSRHIRTVYIPTATHLRAYLSVFSPGDSMVPPPPARFAAKLTMRPHLVLYGFLDLHRDTSEWSAQGLGNSAAALVELGHRLAWDVAVIEPRRPDSGGGLLEEILSEPVPILSNGGRRFGIDSEQGGWSGRRVQVGRVLMRWFRFRQGLWDVDVDEKQDVAMEDRPA
ncbi:hypothetical protein DL764_002972 [Monosporascus ibericus]|uniref:Uncharacterized protein n=1 Tax=Monosporascus ibericus TaxID=155417 RepID=A0A4Q4TIH0_9PEZI|nr:hypothetical protein DL764_002972 [Monosporascus ibericus]